MPHVGWREVLTREHLPRLLVLCLAIWLHAANTMLAATTLPEAVGDIGGVRLISWAFALYLMGSISVHRTTDGDRPMKTPGYCGCRPRARGPKRKTFTVRRHSLSAVDT